MIFDSKGGLMRNRKKLKRLVCLFLVLLMLLPFAALLSACEGKKEESFVFSELSDFSGSTLGCLTGSIFDDIIDPVIPNVSYKTYIDTPGEIAALRKGDIDGIALDMPVAQLLVAQYSDFAIFPKVVADDTYGFVLKKNSPYKEQFNEAIQAFTEDGTMDRLKDKWFSGDEEQMVIDWSQYQLENRANGTLNYIYENTTMPMGYSGAGGQPAGFEVELLLKIADRMDMGVTIDTTTIGALINNMEKADVASGCVSITEERKKSVDFPITHYKGGAVIVCRKENLPKEAQTEIFTQLSDFSGKTLGKLVGTAQDQTVAAIIPNVSFNTYYDTTGQMAAMTKGDVQGLIMDLPVAQGLISQHEQFALFPKLVSEEQYGYVLAKNSSLTEKISGAIEDLQKSGVIDSLKEKWFSGDLARMKIDFSSYQTEGRANGTIRYAFENTTMPMGYLGEGGQPAGFEVELMYRIADHLDMNLKVTTTTYTSLIADVSTDKVDICSGAVSITDERRETVDFATSHYTGGIAIVCLKKNIQGIADVEEKGFFDGIRESFEKTFIRENRWKLILDGLGITLQISLLAGVFGTLLGFGLCLILRSRHAIVRGFGKLFCKLVTGIPSLVLLLIIYFVIFASSDISATVVGIISFSIMFAVSVAGILQTGINAVDKGQWEATAALGFGKVSSFTKVIMPQAVRHVLPIYKSEFVSMLKLTSIVGYISIDDLTKVGDIIRSRTYEPFFPLITTAIIYFIISWAITFLIGRIELRIDPQRRERKLPRGVVAVEESAAVAKFSTSTEQEELIRIEHLKKVYPNITPLSDVSVSIKRGEVISIIGPSGTGKSTLMRCINHLETPTAGTVTVFGENICSRKTDLNQIRRRMGMVFQSFYLFGHLTVIENIMLAPVTLKKQPRQEAYENAMRLLRMVGVAEKSLNYPDELSGGQKQRVAIARTLAMDPEIILLDEPTSALDPTMVGEVQAVIRQLSSENFTMMIVSHEMKFVKEVSTRVFYMDEGVIYEDGTPEQIFENPQKEKTRAFVKRLRTLEYRIRSKDFDLYDLNSKIEEFARRHFMMFLQVKNIQLVLEELIVNYIIKKTEDVKINLDFYEADGTIELTLTYGGEKYDPFAESDPQELSMLLINKFVGSHEFSYADFNQLILKI